ncbi:MAG: hypothetical protein NUV49_01325 [Patescibacteria group bacterium]|nr:hypothetical protein [Patescibacteria group bacterium]
MENDKEQLLEQFKKLPKDLQDAITSNDIDVAMQEISKKSHLHIDQAGELADEVGLVLLGVVHPDDFLEDVVFRLKIDKKAAGEIVADVNEHVFKKVRESLMKVHRIDSMVPGGFNDWSGAEVVASGDTKEILPSKEEMLKEIEQEVDAPTPSPLREEKTDTALGAVVTPLPVNHTGKLKENALEPMDATPTVSPLDEQKKKVEMGEGAALDPSFNEARSLEKDVVKQKLEKSFSIPRAETEHKDTSQTRAGTYKETDPYREPLE